MKKLKIPRNRNELIINYNNLCKKHQGKSDLNDLTDQELFIFIAGQTLDYGRSFDDSILNAKIHIKDRKKAIKLFGMKSKDLWS